MTTHLPLIADISQQLTHQQPFDVLVNRVVERLHTAFDLYHSQLYLVDEENDTLMLLVCIGPVADRLRTIEALTLAKQGLIHQVANLGEYLFYNNLANQTEWPTNPHLPHSCAELAMPLQIAGQVVGVLDIHSEQEERFNPDDILVVRIIADMLAVSIGNMRNEQQLFIRYNKLILGFSTIFSSEFRTPLNAILGFSNMLLDGWHYDEPAESVKRDIQHIYDAGIKLLKLTDGMVDSLMNELGMIENTAQLLEANLLMKDRKRLDFSFLLLMSTEFRTPLNAIIGFSQLLMENKSGPLSSQAKEDVHFIYRKGQYIRNLLNDMCDIVSLEMEEIKLCPKPHHIKPILTDVVNHISKVSEAESLEIVFKPDELLPAVYADEARLKQILQAFLKGNQALTRQERLILTIKVDDESTTMMRFTITQLMGNLSHWTLSSLYEWVNETGRLTQSQNLFFGGGLGMIIARELVRLHGGHIGIKPENKNQIAFYFTIPIATGEQNSP